MAVKVTADTLGGGLRQFLAGGAYYLGFLPQLKLKAEERLTLPSWRVLRYQHVVDPNTQPYPLLPHDFVRPESFYKQMRYLAKNHPVIGLDQLLAHVEQGTEPPESAVVITFDSGWRNTYSDAFPILREFRLPACVFLATAFTGSSNLFWYDKILAAMIHLEQSGVDFPDVSTLAEHLPPVAEGAGFNLARSMARNIYIINYLQKAPISERTATLAALGLALEAIGGLPLDRTFLDWSEALEMQQQGIRFGSNGHTHRTLTEFRRESAVSSDAAIAADVKNSFEKMRAQGLSPLPVFAYPEGEITKEGREVLIQCGVQLSLGIGDLPFAGEIKKSLVLGRVNIHQSNSHSTEIFACRVARATILGEIF